MKAYLIQLNIAWRDKAANFTRVRELLSTARPLPGSLVVLPEMFATGFDVEPDALAEDRDGGLNETGIFLSGLAKETGCTIQGSGICTGTHSRLRNVVEIYAPDGSRIGQFTKLHPFSYGGEHLRFESGTRLEVYHAGGLSICPLICYDLRFPEVFRLALRRNVQMFTVAANWPRSRQEHWGTLLRARAIENQAYVLGVNRCGRDQRLEYIGGSLVFGPSGELLAEAGQSEEVLEVELNSDVLNQWRQHFPVLNDLRNEFLGSA